MNYQANYLYQGQGSKRSKLNLRKVSMDDDLALWLARMCVGEGGNNCTFEKCSAMFWSLLNRFFLSSKRKNWESFLYLVRAFSQPINPRWQRGGDLALKHAAKGSPLATEKRLERREKICSIPWKDIPAQIEAAVELFGKGTLKPPESVLKLKRNRISNWASYDGLKEKHPWGVQLEHNTRFDWFFEDDDLINGAVIVNHWGQHGQ